MKRIIFALLVTVYASAYLQEAFAGSGVIARQNARRGAGHANLAGDAPDVGKALGKLGKSVGKALTSKEPDVPTDPMCDNSDCNASKVRKEDGLPTAQTIDCANAKCNKNFRKKFRSTFCGAYFSDETVVKIYDSETMTSELALEIADRIIKDGRSSDFLKNDGKVVDPNQRVRRIALKLRVYADDDGKVGGLSCLKWLKAEKIYPFYEMEQIKGLSDKAAMDRLVGALGVCDDIKANYG